MNTLLNNILSIDVEDWFHILDSPEVPKFSEWSNLPLRAHHSVEQMLQLFSDTNTKVTFFWLGWMAERFPKLVQKCHDAGHEIASHGYGHVLAYKIGYKQFKNDILMGKNILEDIISAPIRGFRSPGFGITEKTPWSFGVIKEVGYEYDSSIFPASRGHGGIYNAPIGPYFIKTDSGMLPEIPMSMVVVAGKRLSMFGGGYLRLAPRWLIRWGVKKLQQNQQPLIIYIHPREIDPDHPRLPLNMIRRFKCYVNLETTLPKLTWLCNTYSFCTMYKMVEEFVRSFYAEEKEYIPIVDLQTGLKIFKPTPTTEYKEKEEFVNEENRA